MTKFEEALKTLNDAIDTLYIDGGAHKYKDCVAAADALLAAHAAAVAEERERCACVVEKLYRSEPDGIDADFSDAHVIASRVRSRAAAAIREGGKP